MNIGRAACHQRPRRSRNGGHREALFAISARRRPTGCASRSISRTSPSRPSRSICRRKAGRISSRTTARSIRRCGCRRSSSIPASCSRSRSRSSNISTRPIRSRRCCRAIPSAAPRCGRWRSSSPATSIRSTTSAPLRYLKNELGQDQAKIDAWYHHWVIAGFDALEAMLGPGPYAYGADVTLADICLVPQVANARRLKVPLDSYPEDRRRRRRLRQAAGLREGAAGEPAGCGVSSRAPLATSDRRDLPANSCVVVAAG